MSKTILLLAVLYFGTSFLLSRCEKPEINPSIYGLSDPSQDTIYFFQIDTGYSDTIIIID